MFVARHSAYWLMSLGTSLTLLSGSARADVFDDARECAESAVDGLVLSAEIGARALEFGCEKTRQSRFAKRRGPKNGASSEVQARKVELRVHESGAQDADREMRAVELQYGQGSDGGKQRPVAGRKNRPACGRKPTWRALVPDEANHRAGRTDSRSTIDL